MKRFLLLILPVTCYLSPVTLFAQSLTLKVCATTATACKISTSPFLAYATSTGGYRYINSAGGLSASASWQWNPTESGTSSGAFTNIGPYVSGRHICSNTSGTSAVSGSPSSTNGQYCWCQLTNISGQSCSGAPWVFRVSDGSASCTNPGGCANFCVSSLEINTDFRSALLALQ